MDENILRHKKIFEEYKSFILPHKPEKNSRTQYHVMADAIFWDDEGIKNLNSKLGNSFRCILHHRTSLITGTPEEIYAKVYNIAKQYFPEWVGFSEDRTTYCPELADRIERIRKASNYKIEQIENILNGNV